MGNGESRAVAKKAEPRLVKSYLTEARREDIVRALPKVIDADVFIQSALTALVKTPKLQQASVESFLIAVLEAARVGLMPDGVQGAIIPYWNEDAGAYEAEWQPMVQGFVALISRAPKVVGTPTVDAVHDGDEFDVWKDEDGEHLKHRPSLEPGRDDRDVTHVYSVIRFDDGSPPSIEYMDRSQIERARQQSRAPNSPAWNNFYAEMGKKTCLKRHGKRIDKTPELQAAIQKDHALETGEGPRRLSEIDARLAVENLEEMIEKKAEETTSRIRRELEERQAEGDGRREPVEAASREEPEAESDGDDAPPPPSEEDIQKGAQQRRERHLQVISLYRPADVEHAAEKLFADDVPTDEHDNLDVAAVETEQLSKLSDELTENYRPAEEQEEDDDADDEEAS